MAGAGGAGARRTGACSLAGTAGAGRVGAAGARQVHAGRGELEQQETGRQQQPSPPQRLTTTSATGPSAAQAGTIQPAPSIGCSRRARMTVRRAGMDR
jgi:hypothetical protein